LDLILSLHNRGFTKTPGFRPSHSKFYVIRKKMRFCVIFCVIQSNNEGVVNDVGC
jgi:hypothetical protein